MLFIKLDNVQATSKVENAEGLRTWYNMFKGTTIQ